MTALAIFAAGTAAGAINTIVGSGSLVTFPTLIAFGYSPVVANVTNTIGVVSGSISGAIGYREELAGQWPRIARLTPIAVAGGITGAVLFLVSPGDVFERVVPVLILLACVLVAFQPRLRSWLSARRPDHPHGGAALYVSVFLTGIYGGYFGAAQGVILMALLSIFLADGLQRLNAVKNVLAAAVNGIAAVLFAVAGDVAWGAAALICVGAILGGQIGATVGRRLPPAVLRTIIVVVGVTVSVKLIVDP